MTMNTPVDKEILRLADYERQMKKFETLCDSTILPDLFLVIRIDAHRINREKYWYNFSDDDYPISEAFMGYLVNTLKFLFTLEFGFSLAYIAGDEISLLLDINQRKNERRTAKIISQIASSASAGFFLSSGKPVAFLAKLAQLPTYEHVVDYFVWQKLVAERNFYSRLVGLHFKHKQLDPVGLSNLLAKGVDALKEFSALNAKEILVHPNRLREGLLFTPQGEISFTSIDSKEHQKKYHEILLKTLGIIDLEVSKKNKDVTNAALTNSKSILAPNKFQRSNPFRVKTLSNNNSTYGKRKPKL